jgi:hypothetical protein
MNKIIRAIRKGVNMKKTILILVLLIPFLLLPQATPKQDTWKPLRFLEGTWEADRPGVSNVTQVYMFVLQGKYLQMKTKGVFEPTKKKPKAEIHEDMGIFSYDSSKKTFVLRSFHVEGFVNTYLLETSPVDSKTLTFVTQHVENAPPGTKAKLEFKIINSNEIEQSFFVAWPKKDFNCYSVNKLKKIK